jgi:hypothetical protein
VVLRRKSRLLSFFVRVSEPRVSQGFPFLLEMVVAAKKHRSAKGLDRGQNGDQTDGRANPLWGAPRIHGELQNLGTEVSERTVSRLTPRRFPGNLAESSFSTRFSLGSAFTLLYNHLSA